MVSKINKLFNKVIAELTDQNSTTRSQWVTISISFMLAVTLWFLVTLASNDFQAHISYPVHVHHVPIDVQIVSELPEEMDVVVQGKGITLMNEALKFSRDTVRIDFRYNRAREFYLTEKAIPVLREIIPNGLRAIDTYPDTIPLQYEVKASKMVPVISNVRPELAETYRLTEDVKIYPDSVLISGPEVMLEKITFWKTFKQDSDPINHNTVLRVPLLDTLGLVSTQPEYVTLSYQVKPFTEDTRKVKVVLTKVPEDVVVRLWPEEVEVKFFIPMEEYGKVNTREMLLVVDYEKIHPKSRFVIPEATLPDNIELKSIEPQILDYLISSRE